MGMYDANASSWGFDEDTGDSIRHNFLVTSCVQSIIMQLIPIMISILLIKTLMDSRDVGNLSILPNLSSSRPEFF